MSLTTKLFLFSFLICQEVIAQTDSVLVKVNNRSRKNVYLSLAYPLTEKGICTYGWFEVASQTKKEIYIKTNTLDKVIYYHAHNVQNRNENWGGSLFLMVHPTEPFYISFANNAALATSLDKSLTSEQLQELEAYPFREIRFNPKGFYQLNLLD